MVLHSFKDAINALTVLDSGAARIEDRIRLRDTQTFAALAANFGEYQED